MRRLRWATALVGLGLSLGGASAQTPVPQAGGPDPNASTAAPRSLGGVVVDARDGHPLPGATITVGETGGGETVATVRADAEGHFEVKGLRRGKYSLHGDARGYVGAFYQEHEEFSTALAVGMGLETQGLRLALEPEAAVRGRITDETGEGVRNALVTVYRETRRMGRREQTPVATVMADDRGDYEAGPLKAGRYTVAVTGRPWWAVHPRSETPGGASGALRTGVDPALDVAFPLTFYPGVTEGRAAGEVVVKVGEVARADVPMTAVRAVTLVVDREAGEQGAGRAMPQLRVPTFGGSEMVTGDVEFTPRGTEVHGLAPGNYRMQLGYGDAERVSEVRLGQGGAEIREGTGDAMGSVEVEVAAAGTGATLPRGVVVVLQGTRAEAGEDSHVGGVNERGIARVSGLPEGSYRVLVYDRRGPMEIEQLQAGGTPLPQAGEIRVQPGSPVEVKLVVGPALKGIDGLAERAGKPAAGAMVVLVPVDAMGVPELYRRDQSDQDGTWTLRGVLPGRYIVVAVADGWHLDWSRQGVMEPFLAKGVAVEVKKGATGVVRLGGTVQVQ